MSLHTHPSPKGPKDTVTSISRMDAQHVEEVVSIHLRAFPTFFLTFLGPRFLQLLYSELAVMPDSVALVALENNQVVGFTAGVISQSRFYGQLARRRWFAFGLAASDAAMRCPSIIPRLFRALTYSRTSQKAAAQALLMSVAVSPNVSGRGIGQQLVHTFLEGMRARGITSVSLTTDRDNNERTNRFYCQLGFEVARTYVTPEGRRMNEYVIHLDGKPTDTASSPSFSRKKA